MDRLRRFIYACLPFLRPADYSGLYEEREMLRLDLMNCDRRETEELRREKEKRFLELVEKLAPHEAEHPNRVKAYGELFYISLQKVRWDNFYLEREILILDLLSGHGCETEERRRKKEERLQELDVRLAPHEAANPNRVKTDLELRLVANQKKLAKEQAPTQTTGLQTQSAIKKTEVIKTKTPQKSKIPIYKGNTNILTKQAALNKQRLGGKGSSIVM